MNPRTWIATAAVTIAITSTAYAETINEVRAVTYSEDDGGITRVHVRGGDTPTFTVYKLEKPSRVVVDLPHAKLADALKGHDSASVLQPNTWAVSTIASQQLDDGAVRVIVTMARPGRYDIKQDGNDVVVMVMPRDTMPKTANPAELAAAKQQAEAAAKQAQAAETARAEAERARTDAEKARGEADRLRKAAEAAQKAVEQASATDLAKMKAAAAKASRDAEDAKKAAALAQVEADRQRMAAEQARRDALVEADKAKADAARSKAEAMAAQSDAAKIKAAAQNDVAKAKADAMTAQTNAATAKAAAETATREVERARDEVARTKAEADAAKRDAAKTREEALAAKREAENAKAEAAAAKADAAKQIADSKRQLADMEKKTATAQAMEDKARTALAAAQAREEAARDAAAAAAREKELAEVAMKRAQEKRDTADSASRARLVAEAKSAEERLAKARAATAEADAQRKLAEQAASTAKQDLEHSKSALAVVEAQRTQAVAAATDAARKRSEAESAASDATRKRREAELAASEATKRKGQADTERAAAEAQRVAAEQAVRAAEQQRKVAEAAANQALGAKRDAETSLTQLTQKKAAAERAADEVAVRAKAQAKAEAEMAAAKARQAGDDELAAARREVAKLTEERKRAEAELADRRKAVAQQQSEAARLEATAAQARDAATREEARRAQLAQQREAEERQLAKLKAAKVQAQVAEATPVAPAAPAAKVANLTNVTFKGNDSAGVIELAVNGEGNVSLGDITQTHVELIVDNAQLAAKLERTLDVSKFGSPVKKVSSFNDRRSPNRVRLVAELASPAIPTVIHDAGVIRWRFAAGTVASTTTAKKPMRTTDIPPTVVGGFGAVSTPVTQQSVAQLPGNATSNRGRRIYHGATVDFDFKDAPIHDLLRIIADTGGVNVVVPDTIDARVTVRLKRVPWDQALEVILASHGLWYRREGNLYRIAPRKELDAEDEAEAARRAAMVQAEAPEPDVVTLNYASADELRPKFEGMLSPKGKIEVDGRTNSLIINDVGFNRHKIAQLARSLDTQTPQITIEARIVEAQSTFVRQFGIQWGGRALAGAGGGNATGLIFPSSIGIRGANTDGQTPEGGISALPSDFAINLPAATGTGEGGAIGMSLGSIAGNFNINLRLSALEDTGTVRIVSAPKVTVLNNKLATIRSGVSIPIAVVSAAGTQTQFVQADLKLEVTPYVSQQDCSIAMNLDVTKNEPDFVNTGARGDPTILRREAKTTMLVADGETSVLGGIYTRNSGLSYKKVPFFGDLPVIGWFFKSRRENDTRTEILVFITPKITNKASLRCAQ